jgi:hypothetical protein
VVEISGGGWRRSEAVEGSRGGQRLRRRYEALEEVSEVLEEVEGSGGD